MFELSKSTFIILFYFSQLLLSELSFTKICFNNYYVKVKVYLNFMIGGGEMEA